MPDEVRGKEREKERLNDGNNNGQATHGARKPPGPKKQRILQGLRVAQAAVTECWPQKVEKMLEKSVFFFIKK